MDSTRSWTIGRITHYFNRLQAYGSRVQFFMVAYLFFQTVPWQAWMGWALLVGIPVLLWVDDRHIFPYECEMVLRRNPAWKEMDEQLKELLRRG